MSGLEPDWPRVVARKNEVVATIRGGLERRLASGTGPRLIRGWARFESNTRIIVDGQALQARSIIVATGVAPVIPDLPGLREVGYLTNEDVMDVSQLPDSMIILGGGPEGMEFGQIFQRFGTKVTVWQRRDHVLPHEDVDISTALEAILRDEGLNLQLRATPKRITGKNGEHVTVIADVAGHEERFEASHVLLATGRRPRSPAELGLDIAGVRADERGGIQVDQSLKTTGTAEPSCCHRRSLPCTRRVG